MSVVLTLSSVVPSLLLLAYFYSRDVYPEPARVVLTTFALGVATIPGVLGFAWVVDAVTADVAFGPYTGALLDALVYAALPEETLKLAVLLLYAARHSAFDEPMDGIVYGVAASLGFATLENVLYVQEGGLRLAAVRAVTTLPCHCTLGAIMGHYVGQARFGSAGRAGALVMAWSVPTALHTLYDFPLFALSGLGPDASQVERLGMTVLVFGVLGFTVFWAVRLTGARRRLQRGAAPHGEVPRATGAWLLLGFGGVAATSGGLLCASALQVALGSAHPTTPIIPLVAGAGLTALGVALFVRAVRRLNGAAA